ncbi:hypothetical protein chiPu_0016973 [Chiloscyllium punctatum]|uniref:Uncharacterized protein n=1 Tax=Chiloscyllium punctatum TaxID=137246 RepID=A0A401T742_CHIPU|nr:hypothetical protein [Chiloscyllium punctatum]
MASCRSCVGQWFILSGICERPDSTVTSSSRPVELNFELAAVSVQLEDRVRLLSEGGPRPFGPLSTSGPTSVPATPTIKRKAPAALHSLRISGREKDSRVHKAADLSKQEDRGRSNAEMISLIQIMTKKTHELG